METVNQTGIAAHVLARRLRLVALGFAAALGLAAGLALTALGFAAPDLDAPLAAGLAAGFGAPPDFTAVGAAGFALGLDFVLPLLGLLPAGLPEPGCGLPPEP